MQDPIYMGVWPTINSNVHNAGKLKMLRHTSSKFETSLDHTSGSHKHFKLYNTKIKIPLHNIAFTIPR